MSSEYRGGNSRLLAKSLDGLGRPLAILDWQGEILFANSELCALVKADATQLVGRRCSWEVGADDSPHSAVLTALAPPASALEGQFVGRQLTVPILFGSTATGQVFLPIRDSSKTLAMIVVILGDWEEIKSQFPTVNLVTPLQRRTADEILVRLRSQWASLESLLPLLGESPAIQLAMQRAQIAIQSDVNLLVTGPRYIGKSDVVRGVFAGRLKRIGLARVAGQFFPVDCAALDAELLLGMLDVFSARLRPDATRGTQLLVLENLDRLTNDSIKSITEWCLAHTSDCSIAATSCETGMRLMERGPEWNRLLSLIATVDIHIPPLSKRREDIDVLVQQVLAAQCAKHKRALLILSAESLDLLTAYSWPENLAELHRSVADMVQHAVFSASILPQHLPVGIRTFAGSAQTGADSVEPIKLDEVLTEIERIIVSRALKLSPRNRARVARWLGISRPRLLRRLEQLGLNDLQKESNDEEE